MAPHTSNVRGVRVALVGCGQIADAHLQEARKIAGTQLVAVCDRHEDLARQAAARFRVADVFTDLGRMLAEARPDVLHITTPPQSHKAIAIQSLVAGVHVYVEKPFTVDAIEADEIFNAAEKHKRLVSVGHDQLYDPAWLECRRRIQRGELGSIVHVDSVQGYHLDGSFGSALLNDPAHWVHQLPGGLFQNVFSHAVYRVTELLPDPEPRVSAHWFGRRGAANCPTELRVLLQGVEVSASLVFTSSARPAQRAAKILGTRGSIDVDLDTRIVRRVRGPGLPGPFGKLDVPFRQVKEATGTLARNALRFLRNDIHYFAGMKTLFGDFYRAIATGGPPPIPYAEIRRVTAIMDSIFAACRRADAAGVPA